MRQIGKPGIGPLQQDPIEKLLHNDGVTGTLGVLERADVIGILSDLPSTLARLEASGFYLSVRLRDSVLARYRSRQGIGP